MGKQQLRVHTLAKELGVSSKDILEKCRAENIILNNHMATLSMGLAESIREWFSSGVDVTSVEEAAPVDLTRVKRKPRKVTVPAAPETDGDATLAPPDESGAAPEPTPSIPIEAPAPPTVVTAEETPPPVFAPAAIIEAPVPQVAPPPPPPPTEVPRPAIAATIAPPPAPPAAPPRRGPAVVEPPKPTAPPPPREPVRPAGPQVVPRRAELQGPRVVRIEAPEPVRPLRPRPGPYVPPPPAGNWSGGAAASGAGAGASGVGTRGKPAKKGKEGEGDRDAVKNRSRSPRRQGTGADVIERMREWRDQDVLERKERLASATGHGIRDRQIAEKRRQTSATAAPVAPGRRSVIQIETPIALKDFCAAIGAPFSTVSARLMEHTGKLYTINQSIDAEAAEVVALDLGVALEIARARTALERLQDEFAARERTQLEPRPPVVAMLGHVDHGKTSLLDAIRKTKVAAGEAGGITQHIGAYRIRRGEWDVTFLDTPGHEAFTSMRARGANMTDVVVLVVAADDGVMPQTQEAINHARAAGVQIVVALNKIDLPGIDTNRLYGTLVENELTPTEWGGNTDVIKTSAVKGDGIDELLSHLTTLTELLDLKADPTIPARCTVIEAQVREGRGAVAQVLVREGTLKLGQNFVCGAASGKIRSLIDDQGQRIREATPGTPVEVGGLDELPRAGDELYVVDDLSRAKEVAAEVRHRRREESLQAVRKPATLEDLLRGGQEDEIPELNVIVKCDGQASVDALRGKLGEFPSDKARLRILHAGVGAITEADVMLAHTSKAVIFGFHIVADDRARQLADQLGVQIRLYRVIYEVLDDVQKALEGLLEPEKRHEARGKAEVRQVFNIRNVGTIAGCLVVDGIVSRSHKVRLVRDGRVVLEGSGIGSLKRVKDDAREVRAGLECGIKIEGFDDVKPGDVIEAYEVIDVAQKL